MGKIFYNCGHKSDGVIILDDNELSISAYYMWADIYGNLKTEEICFDCFLKELNHNHSRVTRA